MSIRSNLRMWLSRSALFALVMVGFSAHAQTTMSIISESGDYIGQGNTYVFDTVVATAPYQSAVVFVEAYAPGHSFYVSFSLPTALPITPGVYTFGPNTAPSYMTVSGDARACSGASGRLEILEASFDGNGRAQRFRANYEYRCGGAGQPGLFGEISIVGPPPPPLEFVFTIDDKVELNRVTGVVTMSGTIACSADTSASASLLLSQTTKHRYLTTASGIVRSACSPMPRRWTTTAPTDVSPSGIRLDFRPGAANVNKNVFVADPKYNIDRFENGNQAVSIAIDNR